MSTSGGAESMDDEMVIALLTVTALTLAVLIIGGIL